MRPILFFIIVVFLNACNLAPKYETPLVTVPDAWKEKHTETESCASLSSWWEVFEDSNLNRLEDIAVKNNPSLLAALQRVFSARAAACVKKADLFPQLNLDPSYSDSGSLFQINMPPGIPGTTPISSMRITAMQYSLPFDMSYEIDLWGKLRNKYNSALFNAEAQEEAYYTSLLTLTSDLAISYFQMRSYDSQLEVLEKTIKTREKNYNLNKSRYEKGLANLLDVTQAETDLANSRSTYEDTLRARDLEENKVAILIGVPPSLFSMQSHPLKEPPPQIPAGIPSNILIQRPDIAQAERTLASERALIGVARAEFLPSISLTGTLGYLSPDFSQFLKWISRLWMIGADVNQNIFDGGRKWSNLTEAWANFREASETYQQTVLTAFQEVEDALSNIEQQGKQSKYLKIAVDSSTKSTEISTNRYYHGLDTYLQVVDNEKTQLQSELSLASLLGLRYTSTIQLIKALGGSWSNAVSDIVD